VQPLSERVKFRGKIVAGVRRSCVQALIVVLFSINTAQLFGFGAAGPFAHSNITRFAIERFSQDQGIAVDPTCAELIIQGNIENDVDFTDQDIYHCDNNNLVGCSRLLGELKHRASGESNRFSSLETMGNALHIVQDFYAHSNWVEKAKVSMALARWRVTRTSRPCPTCRADSSRTRSRSL
jgi:hypothetical protein